MGRHAKPKVRGVGAKRLLARATAVATFATGGVLADASSASTHNGHIHVAGTNDYGGLALRSEPNTAASVHQRLSDGEGDVISFLCIAEGEQVDGLLATNKWAKVHVPRPDGIPQEGYISLAYTDLLQSELGDMRAAWNILACDQQAPARLLFTERRAKDTPDDKRTASNFGPDHGQIEGAENGTESQVTLRFSLNSRQLENLRQLGEFLEIDFALRGYNFPAGTGIFGKNGWDDYSIKSNLPDAIKDVSFGDTSGVEQHPAATGIFTARLEANKDYFVALRWDAGKLQKTGKPEVSVNWTAGHWGFMASGDIKEKLVEGFSCAVPGALRSSRRAWCVFPTVGYSLIAAAEIAEGQPLYPEFASGYVPIGENSQVVTYAF